MTDQKPTKSWFQFSIATMLFIAPCVAGALGGYRAGFDRGYGSGSRKRQSEKPYPVIYSVADILADESAGSASLVTAIEHTIAWDTWDTVGGAGSIAPIPENQALVISQTSAVHEDIAALLMDIKQTKSAMTGTLVERPRTQQGQQRRENSARAPASTDE